MNILNKKINWEKLEWEDEQRTIQEGKQDIKTEPHLILKDQDEDREITQIDIPSLGVDPDSDAEKIEFAARAFSELPNIDLDKALEAATTESKEPINISKEQVDPDAPRAFTDAEIRGMEMIQRAKDLETLGLQDRDEEEQIKSDEREEFEFKLILDACKGDLSKLRPYEGQSEESWKEMKCKVIERLYGSK